MHKIPVNAVVTKGAGTMVGREGPLDSALGLLWDGISEKVMLELGP